MTQTPTSPVAPATTAALDAWSYDEAFARNLGLISPAEQQTLRHSRVAIAGMGGVGGIHLMTLARMGIGAFRIADPDTYECANLNRQYGADVHTMGRGKARVMAEKARAVNPELDIDVLDEPVTADNVDDFLRDVDVLVDGIDFFSIDARRLVFRHAQQRGIWGVTAGPMGFSTAWISFDPDGMTFDRYFDLSDDMDPLDKLVAFAVGLTPRATHLSYLDLSQVDLRKGRGPSLGLACHLASGVAGTEVAKILLGRRPLRPAPWYTQFDAYRCVLRKGRLTRGNRGLKQRIKCYALRGKIKHLLR